MNKQFIDLMLEAYVERALWSSTDDNCDPLDNDYGASDISPETLAEMRQDCADFLALLEAEGVDNPLSAEQTGHDFWLTRNGHGAGFWDRGLGEVGETLTKWAKTYSGVDLYAGDDGLVYSI